MLLLLSYFNWSAWDARLQYTLVAIGKTPSSCECGGRDSDNVGYRCSPEIFSGCLPLNSSGTCTLYEFSFICGGSCAYSHLLTSFVSRSYHMFSLLKLFSFMMLSTNSTNSRNYQELYSKILQVASCG